ncbi:MAG: tyrosine-type recombinase/integrase [Anaerolineales bacterium]|nr:tyrosine-type recombinase/integrase [Anaerolineales bacterium]
MDILQAFETYLQNQDRADLTVKGYRSDVLHFIRWFEQTNGETFTLAGVTPTDVREYRQHLLIVERRKAATVNRRLAAISVLMRWATTTGLIEQDPTQDIRQVPLTSAGPKYLDKKQQFALQRAIERDLQISRLRYPKRWRSRQRDASLVIFLMHTGLRLQEALDLRLGDLVLGDRKGLVTVQQGKGGRQRIVPLNAEARKALQEWLSVRPQAGSEYIWVAVEGDQDSALSSRSAQRVILRLGQEAGLPDLTPHVLRHTFGKNLIDSGVGLEKVATLLGHSSLNTTRIYITPNQNDLERAVEILSNTI